MTSTVRAIIREGCIETLEPMNFPVGARVLVTLQSDDEGQFWHQASEQALHKVWDNAEDDIYAALLEG